MMWWLIRGAAAGMVMGGFVLTALAVDAAEVQAHRAVYTLEMTESSPTSRFASVTGGVKTSIERTCDGWISAEEIRMTVFTQVGGEINQKIEFTGWESSDGLNYRFATRSRTAGDSLDVRGHANLGAGRSSGRISYQLPRRETAELPANARFPIGHVEWVIDQALAGRRQAEAIVFDGSDDEGPERMVVFVGPAFAAGEQGGVKLAPSLERPGWSMRFAAFPIDGHQLEPNYEFEAKVLDNGILAEALLDFEDFKVLQTLTRIEAVADPQC